MLGGNSSYYLLGATTGSKNKSIYIWQWVVERSERKLARWKSQYLSLGDRLELINSVLDSLSTYVMSMFSLHVKVEKRLDKLKEILFGRATTTYVESIVANQSLGKCL